MPEPWITSSHHQKTTDLNLYCTQSWLPHNVEIVQCCVDITWYLLICDTCLSCVLFLSMTITTRAIIGFLSGDKMYWMSLINNSGEWTWDGLPANTDLLGQGTNNSVSLDRPHTCGLMNETNWHVRCCTESEFYICEKGTSPFGVDLVSHKMHLIISDYNYNTRKQNLQANSRSACQL